MEEEIISLYLSGYGSTTIVELLSLTKRKVLKVLNANNLIPKKSSNHYDNFEFDGKYWKSKYTCNSCSEDIEIKASKPYYLARNLKKKNICKKCSLDLQVGEGNPFYNKKHTDETINKISSSKTGIVTSDHMSTDKYRKIVSDLAKERWGSGKMEKTRLKLSQIMKDKHIKGEIKSINRSKAEFEIIDCLERNNIQCEPNYHIDSKIYDIYIPKYNLLVEYNGDYWHCNPKKYSEDYFHSKKNKTAKEIWEYDKNKLDLANQRGYNYLIIWESDYKLNPNIINVYLDKYETRKN